jgi:hypothetical protein
MSEKVGQPAKKIPQLTVDELELLKASDGASGNEASLLGSGFTEDEIRRRAADDEYLRGKKFKDHFERLAIAAMWIAAAAILAVGSIWIWHLLASEEYRWLSKDAVDKVQNIFTGGILISAFADHFRKRVN